MAFWPFLMGAAGGLTLWGLRHDAWKVPAIALAGYVAMRFAENYVPSRFKEVAYCTIWLVAAYGMAVARGYVPAFFYALAGLAYLLFVVGLNAGYLSFTSSLSFLCDVLALISIGGGLYGLERYSGADGGGVRPVGWFVAHSAPVAPRKADAPRPPAQG